MIALIALIVSIISIGFHILLIMRNRDTSEDGSQGLQGEVGPQGLQGEVGPAGPAGPAGYGGSTGNFMTTSASELGYEISATGNNLIINKTLPIFDNMIAPFNVDWNDSDVISNLESKGWYLCDGTEYTLDDETTFTAPDLRGRFIWGGQRTTNILPPSDLTSMKLRFSNRDDPLVNRLSSNNTGGEAFQTLNINQIPRHNHGGNTSDDADHKYNIEKADHPPDYFGHTSGNWSVGSDGRSVGGENGGRYKHTHPITPNGGGQKHNNLPPYIIMAFFIYKANL